MVYMELKNYIIERSTEKTVWMTTAKESEWYKLAVEEKITNQIMSFKYLTTVITSNSDITMELRDRVL